MSQLLKMRIKWGTLILAGLAISFFNADEQLGHAGISSSGLTQLRSKAEALTSAFFCFFTNDQDSSKETQSSERNATSKKVDPGDQELKI